MSEEKIRIFLRIRPIDEPYFQFSVDQSFKSSIFNIVRPIDRSLTRNTYVNHTQEKFGFTFEGVLLEETKQEETFERTAKPCVLAALEGFNSTIFCYGQTGSGKTWTMTGGLEHYEDRGVIPRTLEMIFKEVEKRSTTELMDYVISISYLEIYKGRGYDLLDSTRDIKTLKDLNQVTMPENSDGNIVLQNLRIKTVRTESDALEFLWIGDNNRVIASTEMNDQSSRSHCIFTVLIESRPKNGSAVVRVSKLHLVDLAGSERVFKTSQNSQVDFYGSQVEFKNQVEEARGINLSLHFLEHVIVALGKLKKNKDQYIPYRNTMLTRILRDSIGGNCKTVMIANVNPSKNQIKETISTCRFANRVASIRQRVSKNEAVDSTTLVKILKRKVATLKEKLAFYENKNGGQPITENDKAIVRSKILEFIKKGKLENNESDVLDFQGNFERIQYGYIEMRNLFVKSGKDVPDALPNMTFPKKKKVGYGSNEEETEGEEVEKDLENRKKSIAPSINSETVRSFKEQVKKYETAINLRNIEIDILVNMLTKKNQKLSNISTQTSPKFGEKPTKDFSFMNTSSPKTHQPQKSKIQNDNFIPPPEDSPSNSFILSKKNSAMNQIRYQAKIHVPSNPQLLDPSEGFGAENPSNFEEKLQQEYGEEPLTVGMLDRARAFQMFRKTYRKHEVMERTKQQLGEKFIKARNTAKIINQKRMIVNQLKSELVKMKTSHIPIRLKIKENQKLNRDVHGLGDSENSELVNLSIEQLDLKEEKLKQKILYERDEYFRLVESLKKLKSEIDYIQRGVQRSTNRLQSDFEKWYQTFSFRKSDYKKLQKPDRKQLRMANVQDLSRQVLNSSKSSSSGSTTSYSSSRFSTFRDDKENISFLKSSINDGNSNKDENLDSSNSSNLDPLKLKNMNSSLSSSTTSSLHSFGKGKSGDANDKSVNSPFLAKLKRYQELRRKMKENNSKN